MNRPTSFPAFLEPQRLEARRLYEVERWRFDDIAQHFGVTKGAIAGMANRQQWLRVGEAARRRVSRKPKCDEATSCPGPRDAPAPASPEPLAIATEEPPVDAAPVVDAPGSTATASEDSASPEAERGSPPAAAVAAEEVVAGASSAGSVSDEVEHAALPDELVGAVPMVVRPRAARVPDAGNRSTAERRLDTILGHARAGAAPSVLTMPRAIAPTVRPRSCQWPHGEPGTETFRFCEAPVVPGRSYCLDHCQVAYVPRRSARENAA